MSRKTSPALPGSASALAGAAALSHARRPRRPALAAALLIAFPALAMAQAEGATSSDAQPPARSGLPQIGVPAAPMPGTIETQRIPAPPGEDEGGADDQALGAPGLPRLDGAQGEAAEGDEGRGALNRNFRRAPLGPDGQPLDYKPPVPPHPKTVALAGARLKLLDKMTGQVEEIDLRAGETRDVERLEVALRACRAPEEDTRQDAYAYLEIRDLREETPRFEGWMFASSPALSALDHARYDLWVLSCSASEAAASSGSE